MKLIVGLGNPGKEYEETRHNVGFQVIHLLAQKWGCSFSKKKFESEFAEFDFDNEKIILALPQTYMNLSGRSVASLVQFFKIEISDLAVVHDELDLPVGRLKVIKEGGAAGNRGVLSIQEHLKTKTFCRFRIGIGKPQNKTQTADFVLNKFYPDEKNELKFVLERVRDGAEIWIRRGIEAAIQYCNSIEREIKKEKN